jgi:hypothetical protein
MAQKYKIITPDDDDDVYERSETYISDIEIRMPDTGVLRSPPTDVQITIYDPCGTALVSDANMTEDDEGEWSYQYTIPAAAEYGQERIDIKATATDSSITIFRDDFFVFSYDLINRARRYSGINKKSASNEDVALICNDALRETINDITIKRKNEVPICDPDIGKLWDGSNTTFRLKNTPIVDFNYDGDILGSGETFCTPDVEGYWIDADYVKHDAFVKSIDEITGRCTIVQDDGVSAIPADAVGIYCTYYTRSYEYNENTFKEAVAYLAAHHLILKLTDLHNATMADLPSNQKKLEINLRRFKTKYKEAIDRIREGTCGGI